MATKKAVHATRGKRKLTSKKLSNVRPLRAGGIKAFKR